MAMFYILYEEKYARESCGGFLSAAEVWYTKHWSILIFPKS